MLRIFSSIYKQLSFPLTNYGYTAMLPNILSKQLLTATALYCRSFVNMDDAWDLHAVVKSCTTATAADNTVSTAVNATKVEDYDDGSYNLEVLASGNEDNKFLYPSTFGNSFSGGLEDVYKAGCGGTLPSTMATTSSMANVAIDLYGEGFVHEH
ncbi:hypothetical protein Tco_1295328, partial [Tanacetum coccineum]